MADAELVALRVPERGPRHAPLVVAADQRRTQPADALHLRLQVVGAQVEVDPVLGRLGLGDLEKEHPGPDRPVAAQLGHERVHRAHPVAGERRPEPGQGDGVGAVEGDAVEAEGHRRQGVRTDEELPTAVAPPVTIVPGEPPATTLPPTSATAEPELVMTRPGAGSTAGAWLPIASAAARGTAVVVVVGPATVVVGRGSVVGARPMVAVSSEAPVDPPSP